MIKYIILLPFFFISSFASAQYTVKLPIPIYIKAYGVEILEVEKIGDTIDYEKSSIERFKFVFYDLKGKCYMERYVNNKLSEKGYYENSLDTLKRYVSGRNNNGTTSPIYVQSYFEPLKNGLWLTYKYGKEKKEEYVMGIAIEHTVPKVIRRN